MSRIAAEHVAREAIVYVRQSTHGRSGDQQWGKPATAIWACRACAAARMGQNQSHR